LPPNAQPRHQGHIPGRKRQRPRIDAAERQARRVLGRPLTIDEIRGGFRVSFSRIFGEQATFLRASDGVDRYGEHAERYEGVNFFGEAADQNGD
jgi:hypothetical protein